MGFGTVGEREEEAEGGGRGEGGGGGADREKDEKKKKKWRERKFIRERREKTFVKNNFFVLFPGCSVNFSPPAEDTATCLRHPFTNNFLSHLRSLHPHRSERH